MWEIWAYQLLPKALKSCPKSNKSPNQVPLPEMDELFNHQAAAAEIDAIFVHSKRTD